MKYTTTKTPNPVFITITTDQSFCSELLEFTKENLETAPKNLKKIVDELFKIEDIIIIYFDEVGRIEIEGKPEIKWDKVIPQIESILNKF